MISYVIFALGLMIFLEGLVFALAPSLIEDLLNALREIPLSTRRHAGAIACVFGLTLVIFALRLAQSG